jgi:hypothetical protein
MPRATTQGATSAVRSQKGCRFDIHGAQLSAEPGRTVAGQGSKTMEGEGWRGETKLNLV